MYRLYFRFLETSDEYFEYPSHASRRGRWNIYGLNLPDNVLKKVYRENALRRRPDWAIKTPCRDASPQRISPPGLSPRRRNFFPRTSSTSPTLPSGRPVAPRRSSIAMCVSTLGAISSMRRSVTPKDCRSNLYPLVRDGTTILF